MRRRQFLCAALAAPLARAEKSLTSKDRVDRTLKGADVDRPPFSHWHHFGLTTPEEHAKATLAFHQAYRTDIVKVMSAFAYPDAYTIGSLGSRVLEAPSLFWMQCFATKSWNPVGERLKLSLRLDGHNLPHKNPNVSAPNTTYNLNNPGAFGRFTGTVGDFSNFGTAQANVQANIRVEF